MQEQEGFKADQTMTRLLSRAAACVPVADLDLVLLAGDIILAQYSWRDGAPCSLGLHWPRGRRPHWLVSGAPWLVATPEQVAHDFLRPLNAPASPRHGLALPLTDVSGAVVGALQVQRDLSAPSFSREEIAQLTGLCAGAGLLLQAERALRSLEDVPSPIAAAPSQGDLVATLSHELRTPLTAILGYTELLIEEGAATGEVGQYLETIMRHARGLLQRADDLIDLATVENAASGSEPSDVNLTVLIELAIRGQRQRALDAGVELDESVSSTPVNVWCDGRQTSRLLERLLALALERLAPGRALIAVRRLGEAAHLSIAGAAAPVQIPRDAGTDAPLDVLIVRRLTASQGGRFWLEHQSAGPIVFHLILPTALAAADRVTFLPTRERVEQILQREASRAVRYSGQLSLVRIAIDPPARLGHGDQLNALIVDLAEQISSTCRASDHLGRIGVTEFACVLTETGHEGARRFAEKVRDLLQNYRSPHLHATESFGVFIGASTFDSTQGALGDVLLQRSEQALHVARAVGSGTIGSVDPGERA